MFDIVLCLCRASSRTAVADALPLISSSADSRDQRAASQPGGHVSKLTRDIPTVRATVAVPLSTLDTTKSNSTSEIPKYIGWLKNGFVLLAKNTEKALEGTPFKIPVTVLNTVLDLANTIYQNHRALKDLLEQTAKRLDVINAALEKTTSTAAQNRVRKFCEILTEETSNIDVLLQRRTWERILESDEDKQNIVHIVTRIEGHLKDFQIDVIMSIERNTEGMMEQLNALRIDSWPRSKNATYGADLDTTLLRREACTPDTRVSILREIREWVENPAPDLPPVFWLAGPAGCGKSTIAFSISQDYDESSSGPLAATFFCSRQFQDTRERKWIIPSIAYQLARYSNSFRRALVARGRFECPEDTRKHMHALLVDPWQDCIHDRPSHTPSLLIVIDALDEIADGGGPRFLQDLLEVLRDGRLSGLRFLVTSRLDPGIVTLCENFPSNAVCRLHEVDAADIDHDITTFLRVKLPALKDTPQLVELARRSGGLFIYAATAVRYSNPRPRMASTEQLDLINQLLGPAFPVQSTNPFMVDELYRQVLWSAFSGLDAKQFTIRRDVLHAMISIRGITLAVIAQASTKFTQELVQLVVDELHPVLYVKDSQIYWYHVSFQDFLLNPKRSNFAVGLQGNRKRQIKMCCSQDTSAYWLRKISDVYARKTKPPYDSNRRYDLNNFQNPELASLRPLDMERVWRM